MSSSDPTLLNTLVDEAEQESTAVLAANGDLAEQRRVREALRHSEAQLRFSSELLRRAHTMAGLGTYVIDPRAEAIHMSAEMVQLLGAGADPLTLPLDEYRARFYHPDELAQAKPRADAAYAAGRPLSIESRVVRGDGRVIWLRASSGSERNEQGEPIVLGVVQDVTEQHAALEELAAQTQRLQERLAFETLLADLTARFVEVPDEEISQVIVFAQERTCALFGFQRSSVFEPIDADEGRAGVTHVFPDENGIARKGAVADEYFPWTVERLRASRRPVVIPDARELPPEAAVDCESFARIGIITSLIVPWVSPRGEMLAIMVFSATVARDLPSDVVRQIETAAQVVLVALGRARERRAKAVGQERMRVLTEMLDEAPAGILVVDSEGRTLYANRHVAAIHGYTVVELSSLSLFDMLPPEDHAERRAEIRDLFERGGATLESWHLRKDGTRIRVSVRVLRTQWGSQPALLSVQTDLTERDRAEVERRTEEEKRRASERQFASAFEYASIGKTIVSLDGAFLRVNRMLCQITGYTADELLARRWQDITHGDDLAPDLTQFQELAAGAIDSYQVQKRFRHKGGGEIWVLRSASLVRDDSGQPQYIISQIQDITARVRAEEELDTHRRHLEDLVATRTEEVRKARDAADAASHAKSRFLANMSHEIRTPMNAILGFAQLLLRDPSMSIEQRTHLETINRAGDHLMSLIDGILQLAKVESGHDALVLAPLDLWALVDDLVRLFLTRALDKGLHLALERDADVPHHVVADAGKLRQIVSNLLGNAVKFTAKGRVILRVKTRGAADARRLVIEVADTGPGIDPSERSRLFLNFEQTATGRASNQGTGLGLAISRELVALMQGEITVDSEPGIGTVFRFDVPVAELPEGEVAPRTLPRSGGPAPGQPAFRVLIADDVEDNRMLLMKLLGSAGFEPSQCNDGAELVRMFEESKPDLVLTDVRMPVMGGIEAIRHIRAHPGGDTVRIICVTASAYDTDEAAALAAGANAFIKKPVRDFELLDRISQLLGAPLVQAGVSATVASVRPLTALSVARLPRKLRDDLRQATRSAHLDRMLSLLDAARAHDADASEGLRAMAGRFAYPRILELLDEADADERRPKS